MDLAIRINKKDGTTSEDFYKDANDVYWEDVVKVHCPLDKIETLDIYFVPKTNVWKCFQASLMYNKHIFNLTKEVKFIPTKKGKEVSFEEFQKLFPYYSIYYTEN